MTRRQGSIYEVAFFVDQENLADFDAWLEVRTRESLQKAGITDCRTFVVPGDGAGRAGRVCQYEVVDDAINDFVEVESADIETGIAAAFGEHVTFSDRLLREDDARDFPLGDSPDCLNCGARLRGQYCGTCGQRSRSRLISLWELITDAFGDLFEIDSRLWQTLVPLTFRPGRLTHDYLQGRRARYMPPFRMYLVMSLIFFLVAFFDPREKLSVLFEPEAPASMSMSEGGGDTPPEDEIGETERRNQHVLDEIEREGSIVLGNLHIESSSDVNGALDALSADAGDSAVRCEFDASNIEDMPAWLARRLTPERLQRICERTRLDDGRTLLDNLLDNVPAALIVLLPLMALILKALYPLSRRYYVEHLLFFVHFHAFFFLILTVQILYARLGSLLSLPEFAVVLPLVAVSFYIPVYLFVAMRKVYGQGRLITLFKYIALTVSYAAGFIATMLGALAIAAFSI